jgi:hypothetical protein
MLAIHRMSPFKLKLAPVWCRFLMCAEETGKCFGDLFLIHPQSLHTVAMRAGREQQVQPFTSMA